MPWGRAVLYLLVAVAGLAVCAIWLINRGFEARIASLRDRVLADRSPAGLPDLPPLVRAFALRNGGAANGPSAIHLRHRASLVVNKGSAPVAIEADQWLGTRRSAFVWRAGGNMFGLPVTVIDSVIDGEGLLEARILGTITVAHGTGPDFAAGELQRYLSELPVHPDAILNNGDLSWRQLDERTVEVTGRSAHGEASITFGFDATGDVVAMEAMRPMAVGDRLALTPWRGRYGRYETVGQYRIPTWGDVGWVLPEGLFTYWTGEIVAYEPI
ncbi:MAG: hypothetical protein EOP19_01710 [Hyphomicrobiales bacterium]|nr:MAG: hypothetical protein EOP19_01710 [Hyphomicrobiales bacterium]